MDKLEMIWDIGIVTLPTERKIIKEVMEEGGVKRTNHFLLGQGTYGVVMSSIFNGSHVATKRYLKNEDDSGYSVECLRECLFLADLNHPDVINAIYVHWGNGKESPTLIMPKATASMYQYMVCLCKTVECTYEF